MDSFSVSIVVPVLNEAATIETFLSQLRDRTSSAEIIVADGGSSDRTREIASKFCDRLIVTKRGRALQMNAGAAVASSSTLWFLHADCQVPENCIENIECALRDPQTVGGFFRIRIPRGAFIYRLTDGFAHYAGLLLRMRFGDHGFFCRRAAFDAIGGFPDVLLMEDAEFFSSLRRIGRIQVLPSRLLVSPRRYEQIGPIRLTLAYGLIATLYALGAPLHVLAAIYQWTCIHRPDKPSKSNGS